MKKYKNFYFILLFFIILPFKGVNGMVDVEKMCARSTTEPKASRRFPSLMKSRLMRSHKFKVTYRFDKDLGRTCKTAVYASFYPLTQETLSFEARRNYLADAEVLVIDNASSLNSFTDPWSDHMPPQVEKKLLLRELSIRRNMLIEDTGCWWTTLKKVVISRCANLERLDLSHFYNLEVLQIVNCYKFSDIPDNMRNLSSLKSLKIVNCPFLIYFDAGHLPINLERLELNGCGTNTLTNMHTLTALKSLYLFDCCLTEIVGTLPTGLETLMFYGCTIGDLPNMRDLTALKLLRIYKCPYILTIKNLPAGLKYLDLNHCDEISTLSNLHQLRALVHLSIANCVNLKIIGSMAAATSLSSLYIRNCRKLRIIASLPPRLIDLGIDNCGIFALSENIHELTSLRRLDITRCHRLTTVIESLPTGLEEITFDECGILVIRNLHELRALKVLRVTDCPLLTSIESLPDGLEYFALTNCASLKPIHDMHKVTSPRISMHIFNCPLLTESLSTRFVNLMQDFSRALKRHISEAFGSDSPPAAKRRRL